MHEMNHLDGRTGCFSSVLSNSPTANATANNCNTYLATIPFPLMAFLVNERKKSNGVIKSNFAPCILFTTRLARATIELLHLNSPIKMFIKNIKKWNVHKNINTAGHNVIQLVSQHFNQFKTLKKNFFFTS